MLGLFIGLLLGLLLGLPLAQIDGPLGTWLPLGISLFLGLGMMGLTVAKRFDLIAAAEGAGLVRRPGEEKAGTEGEPRIVVDTSVLIDGRIAEIVESGFIYGTLIVPRFVLDELQHIADSSDTLRRNRGRRGLEILNRMQRDPHTPVEVVEDEAPGVAEVDAKLVELAKRRSRVVLTNDFNLNRVAELQGVRVMNINSLANAVKPAVLPGEDLRVKVIQEGKEAGQGVGFLDDGTMVVVEGGARLIDRDVDVAVTRVLQTVAGRMIFAQPRARLGDDGPRRAPDRRCRGRRSRRLAPHGRGRQAARPDRGPPLLSWTLDAVAASPAVDRLVLVVAPERVEELARGPVAAPRRRRGDRRRADAPGVGGGGRAPARPMLDPAGGDRPVLVHDGARPLVSARSSRPSRTPPSATGRRSRCCPVAETLKRVGDGCVLETVDRAALASAQTPQGARRGLLLAAWARVPARRSPGSSPTRPPCSRPVPSRSMQSQANRRTSR